MPRGVAGFLLLLQILRFSTTHTPGRKLKKEKVWEPLNSRIKMSPHCINSQYRRAGVEVRIARGARQATVKGYCCHPQPFLPGQFETKHAHRASTNKPLSSKYPPYSHGNA